MESNIEFLIKLGFIVAAPFVPYLALYTPIGITAFLAYFLGAVLIYCYYGR